MTNSQIHLKKISSARISKLFLIISRSKGRSIQIKRVLRLMYFSEPRAHAVPLFTSSKILSVNMLYVETVSSIMFDVAFKCMTGHAPEYLTSQFITRGQVSERTTRSNRSFRTASEQRTFYYRTVNLWNNLESFLKLSPSVKILNFP